MTARRTHTCTHNLYHTTIVDLRLKAQFVLSPDCTFGEYYLFTGVPGKFTRHEIHQNGSEH